MLKLLQKMQQSKDFWFVLAASIFFFFMRLPSFFEPYWYGDEGIYEIIGFGLRHGRLLYRDIWDNKPPLLYLIYALFNGDQMPVRVFSFVTGLTGVIVFFFLTKKLFEKKIVCYTTTTLFTLFLGLPFLEGNIANAENFMILPSVAAAFCIVTYSQQKKHLRKHYLFLGIAGFLLGLSFLIKVVAIFDLSAFWVFLFILTFSSKLLKRLKQVLAYSIILLTTFFIPLLVTMIFFATQGALSIFLQSAFFSNVGYVNYGNPQGLLIGKLILLGIVCLFLFFKRNVVSKTQLFIYLWLSFSLFNALFSQRPYTHYLLVFIASFSLFIGLVLQQRKNRLLNSVLLLILLVFMAKNFWYYDKIISYYGNFWTYVTNGKTTRKYQQFFDSATPRDYDVASYIKAVRKPTDSLFIWGNSAQIYKLTASLPPGRYTAAYHITTNQTTLKETQNALIQAMPKYVIILQNAGDMPYQLKHYRMKITFDNAIIYERIY